MNCDVPGWPSTWKAPSSFPNLRRRAYSRNLDAARELGAEVITTSDDDLARGLLRIAHDRNVTQIILGKPAGAGWLSWFRSSRLVRRLMQESGNIDLHVVKAEKAASPSEPSIWKSPTLSNLGLGPGPLLGVIAVTGVVNLGLMAVAGPRVPGLVFLVAVVVLALFVGRGPVTLAGALSALAWNYFFLPPRFTLVIAQAEDWILFGTYFVVALVLGQLVARIRTQAEAERRREERSTALYQRIDARVGRSGNARRSRLSNLSGRSIACFARPQRFVLPSATNSGRIQTAP